MLLVARTRLLALKTSSRQAQAVCHAFRARALHDTKSTVDYTSKYADKLQRRAQEEGASVKELRARVKEQQRAQAKERLAAASAAATQPVKASGSTPSSSPAKEPLPGASVRKDSSPVKPLSSILNLQRILETPHTSQQVSALWTAYHASRSGGTGRGFLCASIPVDTYTKLLPVAQTYPTFVAPIPRTSDKEEEKGYEFYIMQWGMHDAPHPPSSDNFSFPPKPQSTPSIPSPNPRTATILFTPLLEYKLRQTFATPYLVLTFYTDLAHSHGVVLLRGEITPTVAKATSAPSTNAIQHSGEFLLNQQDAQLLTIGVQKFYLWNDGEGNNERVELLRTFHERPDDFKWEELLKHAEIIA